MMNTTNTAIPLISIVIPTFNQSNYIEQTINSILGQNYARIELIIIDGGSTDDTQLVVQKYADSIQHFISEPDNGQAHAINKGFRLATGDIFAWLNSDDMYLPCIFSKVIEKFTSYEEPQLVYGGCLHFCEGRSKAYGLIPPAFDASKLTYYDYIIQPSTFWTRSLWEKVGEIDESYNYALDWDWFIRASKLCEFVPVGEYLSIYRIHENHKSSTGGSKRANEIINIVERYAEDEWISVYKDVYKQLDSIRSSLNRLSKFRLRRLRYLLHPRLYAMHGDRRINIALEMFNDLF